MLAGQLKFWNFVQQYIHTYMPFLFINLNKSLGFRYETWPQYLTNSIQCTLINTYLHTKFKILKVHINTQFHEFHSLNAI